MTAENKASAQAAIGRVHAGGGTNLSGGLFKGIDQHQQAVPSHDTTDQLPSTGQISAISLLLHAWEPFMLTNSCLMADKDLLQVLITVS